MGDSAASLARRGPTIDVDFALIGHQESWSAAADVLAVLRGAERTPLPDDEIKDILPWIPPRAVCHVDVGSIVGTKACGLYVDSFIPPDRLEAAYVQENIRETLTLLRVPGLASRPATIDPSTIPARAGQIANTASTHGSR